MGNDLHGGHGQVCEGEGRTSNSCVLGGCLFSLSLCRRGFQDLLKARPSSLLILCGCISRQTECSKTSAHKIQMPGNNPEESIQHLEQDKSLKSRKYSFV
jgi:hypothetical protein